MRVRYTAEAVSELDELLTYLQERNPAAAAALVGQIEVEAARLARFPYLGSPKYKPGVRMRRFGRFPVLVFYTVEEREIRILSIRHAARRAWDQEQ